MFGFDLFVADIYRAGREADRSGVKRRGYPCPPSLRRQHTGAKRRPQDTVHVHRGGGGVQTREGPQARRQPSPQQKQVTRPQT